MWLHVRFEKKHISEDIDTLQHQEEQWPIIMAHDLHVSLSTCLILVDFLEKSTATPKTHRTDMWSDTKDVLKYCSHYVLYNYFEIILINFRYHKVHTYKYSCIFSSSGKYMSILAITENICWSFNCPETQILYGQIEIYFWWNAVEYHKEGVIVANSMKCSLSGRLRKKKSLSWECIVLFKTLCIS